MLQFSTDDTLGKTLILLFEVFFGVLWDVTELMFRLRVAELVVEGLSFFSF